MKKYILLLFGQSVSQFGSAMTAFALVFWAYSTTGRAFSSSLLAVCASVPYLLVSLFGGVAADRFSKKKIMLVCDSVAAAGTVVILVCARLDKLSLFVLCAVNVLNGLMNAFQAPASQAAVSLLVEKKDFARAGGMQSAFCAAVGMLNPVLAAALLGAGGLTLVLCVDLATFAFAFVTLLFFIKIPEVQRDDENTSDGGKNTRSTVQALFRSMGEGFDFVKKQEGILFLLVMYGVLNFMGAISFDSMFAPLLLARTDNSQKVVGIVSAVAAAGAFAGSLTVTLARQPRHLVRAMFAGSVTCLGGIMLFGMGRSLAWWCAVVFVGCFGTPVYQTYQSVIVRNAVPVQMQGRVFSLQGTVTQSLTPLGCILGALLADGVFEPFMRFDGKAQDALRIIAGSGNGSGMGLLFVLAGGVGIVACCALTLRLRKTGVGSRAPRLPCNRSAGV